LFWGATEIWDWDPGERVTSLRGLWQPQGVVMEFLVSGGLDRVLGYLGERMGLWLPTSAFLRDMAQARCSSIGTAALRSSIFSCLPTFVTSIDGCSKVTESRSGLRWR
jgi:hypothetical protein